MERMLSRKEWVVEAFDIFQSFFGGNPFGGMNL